MLEDERRERVWTLWLLPQAGKHYLESEFRAHYEAIKTNIKFQKMENGLHCQGREGQRDTETRGNSSYSPHAGDPIFKARIETLNSIYI